MSRSLQEFAFWLQRLDGAKLFSRAFSKLPYRAGEISDMRKEGFQDDISETENLSLSTGAHCDTQTAKTLDLMRCFRNYGVKQNIQRDFQWV